MYDMATGQKRREKNHGRMTRRKEGKKEGEADRDWRAEDLLRVFPPWVEGMAGPVLAICRLAGSILTLGGEEEQQEVKVKRIQRKVRKTKKKKK